MHIARRKLLAAALVSAGVLAGGATSGTAAAATRTASIAFHDLWRKLWEDEAGWSHRVVIAVLEGLPASFAYVQRLVRIHEDMQAALVPFYGDAARVLGGLLREHLLLVADMMAAVRAEDIESFTASRTRWFANAEQIAIQMGTMNPSFWPLVDARDKWTEYLEATLVVAAAHFRADFPGEVAAYDRVHGLALGMADFFSNGVIRQFPQAFQGGVL